jgi:hypothetical protein
MASNNQLSGGQKTAPNRAPAAKVIAGALANNRVAQALISALGTMSVQSAVVATSVSTTTNFANLQVGDFLVHIPASPGSVQALTVTTAGTAPFAAVIGDLYVDLRVINLDANNPLAGNHTGNGGTEF